MVPARGGASRPAVWLVLPCALWVAALAVMAADVIVGVPPFNPDTGQQLSIELMVDVGGEVLGSYYFDFDYDPAVVHVTGVQGGTTAEFGGAPATDPNSFTSGSTPLAFAQGSDTSPSGLVSVARLTLQAAGLPADASNLDVVVNSLFNGAFEPLSSTVFPSSLLINVPEAAGDLAFTDTQTMAWTATPNVSIYNVYRGSFGPGRLSFNHACLIPDLAAVTAPDTETPAAGQAFYYLVTGERNFVEGTIGVSSGGQPRPNPLTCNVGAQAPEPAAIERLGLQPGLAQLMADPAPEPTHRHQTLRPGPDGRGDLDGDGLIGASDARHVLEAVVRARALTPQQARRGDVDGDGDVDVADAQRLEQLLAGTLTELKPGRGAGVPAAAGARGGRVVVMKMSGPPGQRRPQR